MCEQDKRNKEIHEKVNLSGKGQEICGKGKKELWEHIVRTARNVYRKKENEKPNKPIKKKSNKLEQVKRKLAETHHDKQHFR